MRRCHGTGITRHSQLLVAKERLSALEWVLRTLIDREGGGAVLVQARSCRRSMKLMRTLGLSIVPMDCGDPTGQGGAERDMRRIGAQLARLRPLCIYVMPDLHPADGSSWDSEWRESLLHLAARSGVPIIEDHPYSGLALNGSLPKSSLLAGSKAAYEAHGARLAARATQSPDDTAAKWSGVIHIGSWGALAAEHNAPVLQAAWIMTATPLIPSLAGGAHRYALPLGQQLTLGRLLPKLKLAEQLKRLAAVCSRRLLRTKALLRDHAPALRWEEPRGGMFLWLRLPPGLAATALLREAERCGVLLADGVLFEAGRQQAGEGRQQGGASGHGEGLRLNYCQTSEEQLEEGVRRLGQAVAAFTARS
ncbi:hypothetical protein [Paenibacillus sp. SYP-B4298]|uniref:hypothetical protein n=1 Tax=Paenibacillus sp. SYP-B4298 TaxID=2996034 RepID=UPI0022DD578E|nr:hypothetical protein [Paenibacillus sp. SYP-B4298]